MAAPVGNKNGENGKRWRMAIDAALAKDGKDKFVALTELAEQLVLKAKTGDMTALKEIGDRVDGKSVQPMDIKGDLNANVTYNVTGLNRGKR